MSMTAADNNFSPGFGLVWHTPLEGFRTGLTLTTVSTDIDGDLSPMMQMMGLPPTTSFEVDARTWAYSAEYRAGSWVATAEYSWSGGQVRSPFFENPFNSERYYGQVTYRINRFFGVGSYYSVDNDNRDDRKGENYNPPHSAYQKDLAACVRIDLVRHLILKVEYHNVDGTLSVLRLANLEGIEPNWQYLVTKVTFAF
jgi:hypothetical protein